MDRGQVLMHWVEWVENNKCFPLMNFLRTSAGKASESVRYHVEKMLDSGVLKYSGEGKVILPGPGLIPELTKMGTLDKVLHKKSGALIMAVLGSGVVKGNSQAGLITRVTKEKVNVTWFDDDESDEAQFGMVRLKKITPLKPGNKLHLTRFESKLYLFSKEE